MDLRLSSSTPSLPNGGLNSLTTWSLEKYSYSDSSNPNSNETGWTHFPQRDSLYLVADHKQLGNNPFSGGHITLKIIWGIQLLEEINLTELIKQQILPEPAIFVLCRPPCLAIKYVKPNDQTIRRFQVRFKFSNDYEAARLMLERHNCPIKLRPQSSSGNEILAQSQQMQPQSQSQQQQQQLPPKMTQMHSYPTDLMHSHAGGGRTPSMPSMSQNNFVGPTMDYQRSMYNHYYGPTRHQHSQFQPMPLPYQALGIHQHLGMYKPPTPPPSLPYPSILGSGIVVPADSLTSPGTSGGSTTSVIPPGISSGQGNLTIQYPVIVSTPEDDDLPPPRVPISLEAKEQPKKIPERTLQPLDSLPSLKKPTPVPKPPPPAPKKPPARRAPAKKAASKAKPAQQKAKAQDGAQPIAADNSDVVRIDSDTETCESITKPVKLVPSTAKKTTKPKIPPILKEAATVSGTKRKRNVAPPTETVTPPAETVAPPQETPEEKKERQFREIESMIIDTLNDDEFVEMCDVVGRVWQKIGFTDAAKDFFASMAKN